MDIIIIAGLAALILYKLYNVLGRRSGRDKMPPPFPTDDSMTGRMADRTPEADERPAPAARDDEAVAIDGPLKAGLTEIRQAERGFNLDSFLAGAFLVRRQGRAVLASARQALRAGRVPAAEAFDGVCLVAAGIALLLPGFLTDVAGFLLLAPPLRRALFALLALRLAGRLSGDGTTIEGQWEAESPPAAPRLDRRPPDP